MVDRERMAAAHELFDPIARDHLALADVDMGRMFGTEGLRVRGKVYAFVGHDGDLIVKVHAARVADLVDSDGAQPMVMRGRPMREWVTVGPDAGATRWAELIDEARAFVDSLTP
ncbi:MmcQ/YjbR family DNA-binding protein [Microbacterium sp. NPDC091313]